MSRSGACGRAAVALAAVACIAPADMCLAQEAMRLPAATQPSRGEWTITQRLSWERFGSDPSGQDREVDLLRADSVLRYGISRELSAYGRFGLEQRWTEQSDSGSADSETEADFGATDAEVGLRWRFWQRDAPGLDTTRLAVEGGSSIPIGSGSLSTGSFNPRAALVLTRISGRVGFNALAEYTLTTGGAGTPVMPGEGQDDLVRLGVNGLWRFYPESFGGGQHGAGYAVLELEHIYETGGDHETLVSPGLLWEDNRWAGELSVTLPVYEDVDDRLERRLGVSVGFRWLF